MTTETIIANTKQMIDDLKTVCANFGLGNASSEYKIITEIFLYKFLHIFLVTVNFICVIMTVVWHFLYKSPLIMKVRKY